MRASAHSREIFRYSSLGMTHAMRFLFRLIPPLLGIITIGAFVALEFSPRALLIIGIAYVVVTAYGYFELFARRVRERDFWYAFLLTIFVGCGGMAFYIALEAMAGKVVVAIITAVLVGIFAEQLYRWFYAPTRMPSYTLDVTSSLMELCAVFFLAADFIGLRIFLRAPLWILVPLFVIITGTLYAIARWIKGETRALLVPALLVGLLFGEMLWALLFLPSSFMVGGALLAIVWYVAGGILRITEAGLSLRRTLPRYMMVGVILATGVILSARWI